MEKNIKTLIILIIIVVVLFIGTNILKNITAGEKFEWNYKKIASASDILNKGTKIEDRELYWNLKDIIYDFLYIMEDEGIENVSSESDKATYIEYYDVLSTRYKKYLNKSEYEERATSFVTKFLEEDHLGYKFVTDFTISSIYYFDDNKYLCLVMGNDNQDYGYIGIELDEDMTEFSIFYIE